MPAQPSSRILLHNIALAAMLLWMPPGPAQTSQVIDLPSRPGVTQRMLTLQLRALEQDGVVARKVHNSVPPHVEYSFTRKGLTLGPILDAMEAWGEANRQGRGRA